MIDADWQPRSDKITVIHLEIQLLSAYLYSANQKQITLSIKVKYIKNKFLLLLCTIQHNFSVNKKFVCAIASIENVIDAQIPKFCGRYREFNSSGTHKSKLYFFRFLIVG